MELLLGYIVKAFIFPPGLLLVFLVFGLLLQRKNVAMGKSVLWSCVVVGYLLSTAVISETLIDHLQIYPPLDSTNLESSGAGAIVILSAGRYRNAREYGGDTVDKNSLIRCRYGAYLHRKTGLPILVSGGHVLDKEGKSLAQVMADVLMQDYRVDTVWLEDKSRTTRENASYSTRLLEQKEIDHALLVTQAWHMPRAVSVFESAGLKVTPAPTAFIGRNQPGLIDFLPSSRGIDLSSKALHEMIGSIWYRIRY